MKKNLSEKKANIIVFRTTLCTQKIKFCKQKEFSENVCLRTKFDLRLKKKQKNFWGKFSKLLEKIFVSPSKNASHTISMSGIVWKAFF